MGQKTLYLVAAFLISGCSYSGEVRAYDGPLVGGPGYYQPVAFVNQGQPILAAPLYFAGVPVSFNPIDYGVYELVDPDGYVVGYAYVDGIDRLRITDLEGNTLYFLHYDSAGYFRAFDPYGAYLDYYGHSYLAFHFHNNRHHFNTPFFQSSRKARRRFRARATKHRKAGLRQRKRQGQRKLSARGRRDREFEGRRVGKKKDGLRGEKRRRTKGSGWKPVEGSGQAFKQVNPSPRGRNTGGAVFGGDFPFQPRAVPQGNPRAKGERRKAKRRATGGQQRKGPAKGERRKAKRQATGGQQRRQRPAATQATPAPQQQQRPRRAVSSPPPSPPPKATTYSEPKSRPSPKARSERPRPMKHRAGPRDGRRRR